MTALLDMIQWRMTEGRCVDCRNNYEADDKKPPCDLDGMCAITMQQHVCLDYAEHRLRDEVFDFLATKTILSTDFDRRQQIIQLAGYFNQLKAGMSGNTNG